MRRTSAPAAYSSTLAAIVPTIITLPTLSLTGRQTMSMPSAPKPYTGRNGPERKPRLTSRRSRTRYSKTSQHQPVKLYRKNTSTHWPGLYCARSMLAIPTKTPKRLA